VCYESVLQGKSVNQYHHSVCGTTSSENDMIISQQPHLHNFHIKHFKTLKTTPTCFDLVRSTSGSFVAPC